MKSIDTLYNGNFFRSRLEARWAYFFDLVGIKYEYEPEGFTNGQGDNYLPDFYLPQTYLRHREAKGVYIEIKHENFNESDFRNLDWFTQPLVLFCGTPDKLIWAADGEHGYQIRPTWDNMMQIWICEYCRVSKIEFLEGNYNDCPCGDGGKCNNFLLNEAAIESVKKRFEHNEWGNS